MEAAVQAAAEGEVGISPNPLPESQLRLTVWLGTMVRLLPHKLNNSCPSFNLFDLDDNNLLSALELCPVLSPKS